MTAEQFAYWLQGYAELTDSAPTPEQWQSIREHLALVFKKVTPPVRLPDGDKSRPLDWMKGLPSVQTAPLRAECAVMPDITARVTC